MKSYMFYNKQNKTRFIKTHLVTAIVTTKKTFYRQSIFSIDIEFYDIRQNYITSFVNLMP